MWNLFSRLAAAEAELGEVRTQLRDAVEGLQVYSGEYFDPFQHFVHFPVEYDGSEPPTCKAGGHRSWQAAGRWSQWVRGNSGGSKLARIATRWDGLLEPGELWQGKLSGQALLV